MRSTASHHLKRAAVTLLKIAIAVLGLWVVVWAPWKDEPALAWRDRAQIAAGTSIRAVKFLEPVPVWLVEKPDVPVAAPDTVGVALVMFSDQPVRVEVDDRPMLLPLTDMRIRGVFAPPGTTVFPAVPGFSLARWVQSFRKPWPQIIVPKSYLASMADDPTVMNKQVGLRTILTQANPWLLLASCSLYLIPFFVSGWRWRKLLEPQGIRLPLSKCMALTFVGQFYSTFLPGITGGDLVKIVYTSRVIGSKTKATVTVLLDRVIGLIALMIIGGGAALLQAPHSKIMACLAAVILGILLVLVTLGVVYYSERLRQKTGLDWLLERPFVPEFVRKADSVLHVYRGHTGVLFAAVAVSLITQIVVPLGAWLSGLALGMHLHPGYYLAYVPPALLAASVPISPPQGLGVMDWMLKSFFVTWGGVATAEQTFILAQAIRFLPLFWNLVGAYWVITGTYSRHQALVEAEEEAG